MDILDALINGPTKPVLTNPLAPIQQQQATIGILSNQQQAGQLDLMQRRQLIEMMQDPAFAQAYSSMLSGQGGGTDFAPLFQKYPMAAGPQFNTLLGSVKTLAEINKDRAESSKADADRNIAINQVLANSANGLATSDAPVIPRVGAWIDTAKAVGGNPESLSRVISAALTGDEGATKQALLNFGQSGSTQQQRAGATLDTTKANLAGPEFALKAWDAAQKASQWAGGGEIKPNAQGGYDVVRPNVGVPMRPLPPSVQQALAQYGVNIVDPPAPAAPQRGPGGYFPAGTPAQPEPNLAAVQAADAQGIPAAYNAGPPSPATSAPPAAPAAASAPGNALPMVTPTGVQGALSPAEQALKDTVLKPQLEEASKSASAAQEAKLILPQLRATLQQGYTGTFAGSEVGKKLLNFASTFGLMSPAEIQQFANTRMSDALVTKLLGPMAHSLSQRGMTQQSQQLITQSKPGTENSMPVAMGMIDAILNDANNSIRYSQALNGYVTQNPTDYGLTGWKGIKPTTVPQGVHADALPPASVANLGKIATDVDTGKQFRSDGKNWIPVQ